MMSIDMSFPRPTRLLAMVIASAVVAVMLGGAASARAATVVNCTFTATAEMSPGLKRIRAYDLVGDLMDIDTGTYDLKTDGGLLDCVYNKDGLPGVVVSGDLVSHGRYTNAICGSTTFSSAEGWFAGDNTDVTFTGDIPGALTPIFSANYDLVTHPLGQGPLNFWEVNGVTDTLPVNGWVSFQPSPPNPATCVLVDWKKADVEGFFTAIY